MRAALADAALPVVVAGPGSPARARVLELTQADWDAAVAGVRQAFLAARSGRGAGSGRAAGRVVFVVSTASAPRRPGRGSRGGRRRLPDHARPGRRRRARRQGDHRQHGRPRLARGRAGGARRGDSGRPARSARGGRRGRSPSWRRPRLPTSTAPCSRSTAARGSPRRPAAARSLRERSPAGRRLRAAGRRGPERLRDRVHVVDAAAPDAAADGLQRRPERRVGRQARIGSDLGARRPRGQDTRGLFRCPLLRRRGRRGRRCPRARRVSTTMRIRSPSTQPSDRAAGERLGVTCPMQAPVETPEKRASVISATCWPNGRYFSAEVSW